MNLKKSRLNNLKMGFQRNSVEYEAIMLDLYLIGILSKEAFESLTGRECPSYVNLPNGMKSIYCRPDEEVLEDDEVEKLLGEEEEEEEEDGTADNSSDEGDSSTTDID